MAKFSAADGAKRLAQQQHVSSPRQPDASSPDQATSHAATDPEIEKTHGIEQRTEHRPQSEPVAANELMKTVLANIRTKEKTVSFNIRLKISQLKKLDRIRGNVSRSQFVGAAMEALIEAFESEKDR